MMPALLLAAVTLQGPPSPPRFEDPLGRLIGQRIRVTDRKRDDPASPRRLVGTLAEYDGRTLTVTDGKERRTLAVNRVRRVDVSRGRHPMAWKGAKVGATVIAVTLLGYFTISSMQPCSRCSDGIDISGAAAITTTFAAMGGVAGLMIGSAFEGERWDAVKVKRGRPTIGLSPVRGGIAVNVSVPLRAKRGMFRGQ